MNLFKKHPKYHNTYEEFDNENNLMIKASRNITVGELITIQSKLIDNSANLLYYGVTFDNVEKNHFPILMINEETAQQIGYKGELLHKSCNIAKPNFASKYIDEYKNLTREVFNDDSDIKAYEVILMNLEWYLTQYDDIHPQDYYKRILTNENRINIERVVEGERKTLIRRIKEINYLIQKIKNEKKEEL